MNFELFEHQKKILADDPKWVGLWQGTGSGKTATLIHLARGRTLVITPKLLREQQSFEKERQKWDIDIDIWHVSKEDFKKYYKEGTLKQHDTVIIDEAHTMAGLTPSVRYKNRQPVPKASKLFESMYRYLKEYPPERLYLATATPVRAPITVLALAWLLGKKWDFYRFRDTFYIKVKKGYHDIWIPRKDAKSKQVIGKLVRQLGYVGQLSDYFDVPEQTFEDIYVELTPDQKTSLKEVKLEFPDPLVQVGKRHQVENGVLAGDEYSEAIEIKDNKIDKLKDFALEFPKMVIFARYINQINKIFRELTKEGYTVQVVTGATKDRNAIIEEAEQSEEYILVVQSQISAGWEVPSFPVMVFASQSYSVIDRVQGEGRIHRAHRLKKNLFITLITKDGIDEAVDKAVKNKQDFNEAAFIEQEL